MSLWALRAADLAVWTWTTLVNRTDCWGAYWPLDRRQQGNSWTAPAVKNRGRISLTQGTLVRHYRGEQPEHVVGLHSTAPGNTSRWGGIDIDKHGDTGDATANRTAALAWYSKLVELGFAPLLYDSNGNGGYHLRAIFAEPIPTPRVFAFLRWLTADYQRHGLPVAPETFPKQERIKEGGFGNWLRLPGRHHSRDYWSTVFDGQRGLRGAAAVAHILTLRGASPRCIPEILVMPVRFVPAHHHHEPVIQRTTGNIDRRIRGYLAKLPAGLGEGQHRDDFGYRLACFLVRDLGLSDAEAMPWMCEWDRRNAVAKGETRLQQIINSARNYGKHNAGCALTDTGTIRARGAL